MFAAELTSLCAPVASGALGACVALLTLAREIAAPMRARIIVGALCLALVTAIGALAFGVDWRSAAWMIGLVSVLFAVFEVDRRHFIIPDILVIALFGLCFFSPIAMSIADRLLGATLMGGLFFAVAFAYRMWRGHDGLGFGDVKLAAAIGAMLGPHDALWTAALASLAMTIWMANRRRTHKDTVAVAPLGSGLAIALLSVFLIRLGART